MKHDADAGREVPRVGVVGLAYGGYNLGEELGPGKLAEMRHLLRREPVRVLPASRFVLTERDARAAGAELKRQDVDCILAVITTFVPDTFLAELLDACDRPVFLWAVEREMQCISVVCGPLITSTLYNRGRRYDLVGADIGDTAAIVRFRAFAQASLVRRLLDTLRVGCCNGRPPIMLSLETDPAAVRRVLGPTVVSIPVREFESAARSVPAPAVRSAWADMRRRVGQVTAAEADGLQSTRYLLAARRLAAKHRLNALSLNCFPRFKSQVCLAVACLNDDGLAAACEGDLHATILMHLLERMTGRPAFNGDWLRMYPGTREVLFSHCGAGAFGLAQRPKDVCLRCSIETRDGLAVCYATHLRGPVTLVNLMLGPAGFRLASMEGTGVRTGLQYEGTPLKVRFARPPQALLDGISGCGAGHHWNGAAGQLAATFATVCRWKGIAFHDLTGD